MDLEYACPQCDQRFRRRDHQQRHLRAQHQEPLSHRCHVCQSTFARRDTLQRHAKTHGEQVAQALPPTAPSSRACRACRQAKRRCVGDSPCARCQRLNIECGRGTSSTPGHSPLAVVSSAEGIGGGGDGGPAPDAPQPAVPEFPATISFGDDVFFGGGLLDWNFGDISRDMLDTTCFDLPSVEDLAAANVSNIQSFDRAPPSPLAPLNEEEVLAAERFRHVPSIPAATYQNMLNFFTEVAASTTSLDLVMDAFPPPKVLDVYVQLYFEYIYPRVPFIHRATFDPAPETWMLVLAAAASGCRYSRIMDNRKHFVCLRHLTKRFLSNIDRHFDCTDKIVLAQTLLVTELLMIASGFREDLIFLQCHRNVLVTICREFAPEESSVVFHTAENAATPCLLDWHAWVRDEKKRRVYYFMFLTECLQHVFLGTVPAIAVQELHLLLPHSNVLWEPADAASWQKRYTDETIGPANRMISLRDLFSREPPQTSFLNAMPQPVTSIVILALFSQEMQIANTMSSWIYPHSHAVSAGLEGVLNGATLLHTDTSPRPESAFDSVFEALASNSQDTPATATAHASCESQSLIDLISIFRFVRRPILWAFTGWRTTPEERQHTRSVLSRDFAARPQQARQCLRHAVRLFEHFRSVSKMVLWEPYCFLVAVLFIWAYDQLGIASSRPTNDSRHREEVQASTIDRRLGSSSSSPYQGEELQTDLHLVGVGKLGEPHSSIRLLEEARRIFLVHGEESRLAHVLATAMLRFAQGQEVDTENE